MIKTELRSFFQENQFMDFKIHTQTHIYKSETAVLRIGIMISNLIEQLSIPMTPAISKKLIHLVPSIRIIRHTTTTTTFQRQTLNFLLTSTRFIILQLVARDTCTRVRARRIIFTDSKYLITIICSTYHTV